MNKKVVKKLLEGDNEDDIEIGAWLLESDNLSVGDKKDFIKKYMEDNPKSFNEKEKKFLNIWLNNKNKNLKLWILKGL